MLPLSFHRSSMYQWSLKYARESPEIISISLWRSMAKHVGQSSVLWCCLPKREKCDAFILSPDTLLSVLKPNHKTMSLFKRAKRMVYHIEARLTRFGWSVAIVSSLYNLFSLLQHYNQLAILPSLSGVLTSGSLNDSLVLVSSRNWPRDNKHLVEKFCLEQTMRFSMKWWKASSTK